MSEVKTPVSFSMSPSLVKRLDRLAKAMGKSRSAYLEGLVRDCIEEEESGVKMLTDPVMGPALLKAFGNRDVLRGLVRALGEDLTDSQLDLFASQMERMTGKKKGSK